MIKDSLISRLQGIQILEKYFQLKCDLDKLASYFQFKGRNKQQLTEFIREKIRQLILEIESQLFRAKKISSLKLFDHASDTLFNKLIKMQFLPEKLSNNFVFEQKCRSQKIERSTTNSKLQIYNFILKFVEQNDLMKFIFVQNEKKVKSKGLFQNAKNIYQDYQLELISMYYQNFQGNYQIIAQKLAALGHTEDRFKIDKLYKNYKNLELIGVYRCLQKSAKATGAKMQTWEKFIQEEQSYFNIIQSWDNSLRAVLIKIAIRDEATPYQIRIICRKFGRRYDDKPLIDVQKKPPKKKQEKYCDTPQMDKLRQQLFSILNGKIWFNYINLQT